MEKEILETIKHIRFRPKMYFWFDGTFRSYTIYFQGFFCSMHINCKINMEREISKWYQKRVKFKAPNMVWFAQFEHINKDLSEQEKIDSLFDTLEEFFTDFNLEKALSKN
ncbi:hypothetical protein [Chryseobacterium sp. SL1]|uniref:hypothetical protein n=1 Tax=Chryseobacterium sp. SL1 TaxID=2995159 RepID=UPI002275807B|nr:hypothetical protein [Chryseobacterium sp. SL1]MCY1660760.1 hypothetical protein [Chryseobacterium sp. SL1]